MTERINDGKNDQIMAGPAHPFRPEVFHSPL
jgi:hypothetical protein